MDQTKRPPAARGAASLKMPLPVASPKHAPRQEQVVAVSPLSSPSSSAAASGGRRGASSSPSDFATVNGRGMWLAWTKSFKTPLLALLDLFDNAVDATMPSHSSEAVARAPPGTVPLQMRTNLDDVYDRASLASSSSSSSSSTTALPPKITADKDVHGPGIVLRNSSSDPIPPMALVLEIYKSCKGTDAVGENGIGVKHACASLSKLSFLFSKSRRNYGLGVLYEDLQDEKGILLPSQQWDGMMDNDYDDDYDDDDDAGFLEGKIRQLAEDKPNTWGVALRAFGKGMDTPSRILHPTGMVVDSPEDLLELGVQRCVQQFTVISSGAQWKDYENVFTVVLAELRHTQRKTQQQRQQQQDQNESHNDVISDSTAAEQEESEGREGALLAELRQKLPYIYLHLHPVDVTINGNPVQKFYWETKLVELTKFEIAISERHSWRDEGTSWYLTSFGNAPSNTKSIRFFIGFDPYRANSKKKNTSNDEDGDDGKEEVPIDAKLDGTGTAMMNNNSSCSTLRIYTYSRKSGRLVKLENDPRRDYGLITGSSDFGLGMTMIVDDHQSTLPLNPTKQDTAFGHSEFGSTHQANVIQWTSTLISFFWSYHIERFEKSKRVLGAAIMATKPRLRELFHGGNNTATMVPNIVPLSHGSFIQYPRVNFTFKMKSEQENKKKVMVPEKIWTLLSERKRTKPVLPPSSSNTPPATIVLECQSTNLTPNKKSGKKKSDTKLHQQQQHQEEESGGESGGNDDEEGNSDKDGGDNGDDNARKYAASAGADSGKRMRTSAKHFSFDQSNPRAKKNRKTSKDVYEAEDDHSDDAKKCQAGTKNGQAGDSQRNLEMEVKSLKLLMRGSEQMRVRLESELDRLREKYRLVKASNQPSAAFEDLKVSNDELKAENEVLKKQHKAQKKELARMKRTISFMLRDRENEDDSPSD